MALLGSDLNASNPANTEAVAQGASRIRDLITRVKAFCTIMFDLETGLLKNSVVTSAMLADTAVTPGTYTGSFTVDQQGRVTAAVTKTTLAGFGITDAATLALFGVQHNTTTGVIKPSSVVGTMLEDSGVTAGTYTSVTVDAKGRVTAATNPTNNEGLVVQRTATLSSNAANVPVTLLLDADVPTGKRAYLLNVTAKVDGGTNWATTASVAIQDTNGTPINFITYLVAALTGNAALFPNSTNVTPGDAFLKGTGGSDGAGLVVVGDVVGTGSDLKVAATILIK